MVKYLTGSIQDMYWDWRCGIRTGGILESPAQYKGASRTESIRYSVLRGIFEQVPLLSEDVLVDAGCGKGRVLGWWLTQGHRHNMIGLELKPDIAALAAEQFSNQTNVHIICGDAIENLPAEGTFFWLYNPFNEAIMKTFRDRLLQICQGNVRLVYAQAKHIHLFKDHPDFVCEPLRVGWLATGPAYLIRLQRNP